MNEEENILKLYNEKVEKLLKHSLLQGEMNLKITFFPLTLKIGDIEPTEEQIESLLIRFRFFYLENESTNFNRVCNLLWKKVDTKEQKEFIMSLRERYNTILERSGVVGLKINGDRVKPKENISVWLNAFYFHSDEEKREQLRYLQESTKGVAKVFFIIEILNLIDVIILLDRIVKELLDEN